MAKNCFDFLKNNVSSALFQNRNFGKKCPDYIIYGFLILNAVLRISRKEIPEIFPCGTFFRVLVAD